MKAYKPTRKKTASYRTLKKLLNAYHKRNLGKILLLVPANPCPSCEADLMKFLEEINQKGYTIGMIETQYPPKGCCGAFRRTRQLVWQELRRRRKQDFLLYLSVNFRCVFWFL